MGAQARGARMARVPRRHPASIANSSKNLAFSLTRNFVSVSANIQILSTTWLVTSSVDFTSASSGLCSSIEVDICSSHCRNKAHAL